MNWTSRASRRTMDIPFGGHCQVRENGWIERDTAPSPARTPQHSGSGCFHQPDLTPDTTSAPPWAWTPSGGTSCSGTSTHGASSMGGVEVVNVCLHKPERKGHERVSVDRLMNRINTSVASAGRHAFLIFDEGKEGMITRTYRRLRVRNPVPSRYETWEDSARTRNILVENVTGGPAFRSSGSDCLLQRGRLHRPRSAQAGEGTRPQVEDLGLHEAFSVLDKALNRKASRRDPPGSRQEMKGGKGLCGAGAGALRTVCSMVQ